MTLDPDEVLRFKEGLAGYQRCVAVANALRADNIITVPKDDEKAAAFVALLLVDALNGAPVA